MFGRRYLVCIFALTICLALSIKAGQVNHITLPRVAIRFEVDNVPINYHFTIFKYEYDTDNVNRDENSVNIKNAKITFGEGLSRNEQYTQFDLPNGKEFELKTEGSITGGNCQFTFSENEDAPITGVSDVVKQGIFNKLPSVIGNRLCSKIRM